MTNQKDEDILTVLEELVRYYDLNKIPGHTKLMMKGIESGLPCILLSHLVSHAERIIVLSAVLFPNVVKPMGINELKSGKLLGQRWPLAIDNSAMREICVRTIERIISLENGIKKIASAMERLILGGISQVTKEEDLKHPVDQEIRQEIDRQVDIELKRGRLQVVEEGGGDDKEVKDWRIRGNIVLQTARILLDNVPNKDSTQFSQVIGLLSNFLCTQMTDEQCIIANRIAKEAIDRIAVKETITRFLKDEDK